MLSKKSYFNLTLYRKLLARFWPMWGGLTVLASLGPLVIFLSLLHSARYASFTTSLVDMRETYYIILTNIAPSFMLGYAILCAMAVWTYLYQHRSVSLMHTLPVTRTNLFVTGCCAGLTFMLLPMAVAGTLLFLVSVCFGLATPMAFLECAAGLILLALLNFGFASLCAMVTGNLLALPAFYFIGNFLAGLLDALLSAVTSIFFFGVNTDYSGAAEWLSPTVYIYQNVRHRIIWEEVLSENDGSSYSTIAGIELEGFHILVIYGLIGVLFLALAWLVYRHRPSESAGDVVSLAFMRPVFKLGVAVCSALSGGLLLYAIFSVVNNTTSLFRMGLCMFVAGAVGFWIADMLVQKSLRVWKTSAVGAGVMALLAVVICVVVRFDLLGVESHVPEESSVEEVTFRITGVGRETLRFTPGQDSPYIQQLLALHRTIIQEKDWILDTASNNGRYYDSYYSGPYDSKDGEDMLARSVTINYNLKNGRTLQRRYSLPFTETLLADKTSYASQLESFINAPDIQLRRIFYGEDFRPFNIWMSNPYYEEIIYSQGHDAQIEAMAKWQNISDPDTCMRLYDALVEDVRAGRWGYTSLMDSNTRESWLELHFELRKGSFTPSGGASYDTEYQSFYIVYVPEMTSLTGTLLELGVPAQALQRPPQYMTEEERKEAGIAVTPDGRYVWEDGSAYYKFPDEKGSLGIIGGADGPTAIIVS